MAISRKKTVTRHNPIYNDFSSPLSVGNGNLAFTADITGLQSFGNKYDDTFPLCTMCHWRVNSINPGKYGTKDFKLKYYDFNDRRVGYATKRANQEECYNWLRENPHKYNIMRLELLYDGRLLDEAEISDIEQTLDLWSGVLRSRFSINGSKVYVKTCCHQSEQAIGVYAVSELFRDGKLKLRLRFPYSSPAKNASDWDKENAHDTTVISGGDTFTTLLRTLDDDKYFVTVNGVRPERTGRHSFTLSPGGDVLSACFAFTETLTSVRLTYEDAEASSEKKFAEYWQTGGFIALSGNERAFELERRVILSQYLTYIQCSGMYPPPETGLTMNSWYGKAHLEMHYWHSFHFLLFKKPQYMESSLWWYKQILNKARGLAESQGFKGIRWPKMVDNDGNDCPSPIAPLLIWQQPHIINYLHTLYRHYMANGQEERAGEILAEYSGVVFDTADFMASYAYYDHSGDRYILGPAMIPAQENHPPETAVNPVFELEYWRFGLEIAIEWSRLLDIAPKSGWVDVLNKLSPLPVAGDVYPAHENCPDTYTKYNYDHPSFLCAMGMLPGVFADHAVMENSLRRTLKTWNRERLWGWDFPVMAMTAARLGLPELAVECLLMDSPKNTYTPNGHNNQIPRGDLPLYLPGNGGLLTAAAMMCAGWDGNAGDAPGFPKDWTVEYEDINAMI